MTNAFAFPCQKVLSRYTEDKDIAPIIKDIANAKQGVMTFSKEVKKYMLAFIHARYDDNEEVKGLVEVLKNWSKYESFSFFEIFKLQDESYFWYDFLNCYAIWKIIQKTYGFSTSEEGLLVLVRLCKSDVEVFKEYKEI